MAHKYDYYVIPSNKGLVLSVSLYGRGDVNRNIDVSRCKGIFVSSNVITVSFVWLLTDIGMSPRRFGLVLLSGTYINVNGSALTEDSVFSIPKNIYMTPIFMNFKANFPF